MDVLTAKILIFQESLFSFLLSADLLSAVRSVLEVLTFVLLFTIFFVMYRMTRLRSPIRPLENVTQTFRTSAVSATRLSAQWEKIRQRLQQPTEAEWKIAVIEADNLVDDVLRRMGYPGTSMGERLKNINSAQISTLDAIWVGHKIRNRIVHDPHTRLVHKEAREALANFEAFLREANVLE